MLVDLWLMRAGKYLLFSVVNIDFYLSIPFIRDPGYLNFFTTHGSNFGLLALHPVSICASKSSLNTLIRRLFQTRLQQC